MVEGTVTIFVVDDDASVRRALERLLVGAGYQVELFASASAYLQREPYDGVGCLLLDLSMPGMDGAQLQVRLEEMQREVPIVFLTAHGDIPASVNAIKHGAIDFLTKPVDQAAMFAAIDEAISFCRRRIEERSSHKDIDDRVAALTERENQVMRYVIGGALNKQIAAELGISEKTVKVHRGHVMQKMAVRSVAELVRKCASVGIEPVDLG